MTLRNCFSIELSQVHHPFQLSNLLLILFDLIFESIPDLLSISTGMLLKIDLKISGKSGKFLVEKVEKWKIFRRE